MALEGYLLWENMYVGMFRLNQSMEPLCETPSLKRYEACKF